MPSSAPTHTTLSCIDPYNGSGDSLTPLEGFSHPVGTNISAEDSYYTPTKNFGIAAQGFDQNSGGTIANSLGSFDQSDTTFPRTPSHAGSDVTGGRETSNLAETYLAFSPIPNVPRLNPLLDGEEIQQQLPARSTDGSDRSALWIPFTCYGQLGVPLDLALAQGDIPGLYGAHDTHLYRTLNSKVSYRLEWPGYKSSSVQKNFKRTKRGETHYFDRREILRQVAEVIQAFILDNTNYNIEPKHEKWRVGPGFIQLHNLVVVGLKKVSKASVQPVLRYRSALST